MQEGDFGCTDEGLVVTHFEILFIFIHYVTLNNDVEILACKCFLADWFQEIRGICCAQFQISFLKNV
jgi:hypothetical protein